MTCYIYRLSPRATGDTPPRPSSGTRVPVPDSAASLDWSSLVDVATKAIEGIAFYFKETLCMNGNK